MESDGRPLFPEDADLTVYWPDVRPCWEESDAVVGQLLEVEVAALVARAMSLPGVRAELPQGALAVDDFCATLLGDGWSSMEVALWFGLDRNNVYKRMRRWRWRRTVAESGRSGSAG